MDIHAELQSLYDRYVAAYRRGDAAGCAACFSENAELFSPYGPPAKGRSAIEATHSEWVAEGGESKSIDVVQSGQNGDLAWCVARFSEEALAEEGVSLNVCERQPDGAWLIRMCSLNEVEIPASGGTH